MVEYGFRLPAAIDNRPQKFEEFEALTPTTIYVSATPADYELERCDGIVAEQVIRPTGLLDPTIEVRPSMNQVDDLMEEIQKNIEVNERTLVTTLTKKMAEELDEYFHTNGIRSAYIHSDVDTLDRVKIMDELRAGVYDVLVGVNLLREGLDLPEVSLVAILDADKEGFLRNERSLTQTIGRAARNVHGRAILYADKITGSMQRTIEETERRRTKQMRYNIDNGITPKQVQKQHSSLLDNEELKQTREQFSFNSPEPVIETSLSSVNRQVADTSGVQYQSLPFLEEEAKRSREKMMIAAKNLDFIEAAHLRDYVIMLEEKIEKMKQ